MKLILYIAMISVCISCSDRNHFDSYHVMNHPVWNDMEEVAVIRDTAGSDNEMRVKTAWTRDSLYFFFEVADRDLRCHQCENDHSRLFLDDMVEFLIDPRNDHGELWIEDDVIYHINLFGYKKDDRGTPEGVSDPLWNGTARYLVNIYGTVNDSSDVDEGYDVEVALSWSELGIRPRRGLVMGVDFVCGDNDGTGRQLFDWAGASPFRHPVEFRLLRLSFPDKP